MKNLIRLAVIFTLIMTFSLLLFIVFNKENQYEERDIIFYNEQLHLVQQELENGKQEKSVERKYDCSIVYAKEIEDGELSQLYKNNALILDLNLNGEYVGKVAFDDNRSAFDFAKKGFFGASIYLWVLMLICGYILIISFYASFVKPVRQLIGFSEEIAKGNLDDPLPIPKNNLFGSFVEAFDIMREELKKSKIREMEAEIARKEMVTDLSHDVKTPISVIKVACEVLEAKNTKKIAKLHELEEIEAGNTGNNNSETNNIDKTGANGESKFGNNNNTNPNTQIASIKDQIAESEYTLEKVTTISQKADMISSIVTNLMHTTLDDMDKLEVRPTEMDSAFIKTLFDNLKNYGNIIIENEVPRCLVYMDRLRMEQVIDNIVGNSHKYAGTDIRVRFSSTSSPSDEENKEIEYVKITIKDSGSGVSEEDLPLITQKYYRGKNTKEANGYGLGLYLVKRYMDLQNGGMEYYNDNGFTVELLVKKV